MESFIAKSGYQGLSRIIKAAGSSAKGFRAAWTYESAFCQEVGLTGALIPFAFWFGRDPVEIGMLVVSSLLVVIVELLNSGIEAVVDRIGDEPHQLSGDTKDMGSAAIFVADSCGCFMALCHHLSLRIGHDNAVAGAKSS